MTLPQLVVVKVAADWAMFLRNRIVSRRRGCCMSDATGIARNPDGSLKLPSRLRAQMQILLDEVQADGVDELEKVSLERLADINPVSSPPTKLNHHQVRNNLLQ